MAHIPVSHVVLLSGGIDSTTALTLLRRVHQIHPSQIKAVCALYGQKHARELQAADAVAAHFHVDLLKINLAPILFRGGGSTLIDPNRETPSMTYKELSESKGISPTYVPYRNGNILSAATALALTFGPDPDEPIELHYGAHAEDAANWAYPDCTPEFNGAMASAIFIGSYQRVRLVTPFQWMTKNEIIARGNQWGAPYHLTYSCYRGEENHCGTCPTCVARQAAFLKAEVADPTEYDNLADLSEVSSI